MCNAGYLNVSLRLLSSQGWLKQDIIEDGSNIQYKCTQKGIECLALAPHYDAFSKFIPILIKMDSYLFDPNSQTVKNDLEELIKNLEIILLL